MLHFSSALSRFGSVCTTAMDLGVRTTKIADGQEAVFRHERAEEHRKVKTWNHPRLSGSVRCGRALLDHLGGICFVVGLFGRLCFWTVSFLCGVVGDIW